MRLGFRARAQRAPQRALRHPFYPGLAVTCATEGKGRCAALAGTFLELAQAAATGVRVRRAVFALNYPGAPFLSESERDRLWQMFEVPVYALLLDRDGRLLAYECEAQEGLHVDPDAVWSPDVLESAPCECGRPGHRLVLTSLPTPRIGPQRSHVATPSEPDLSEVPPAWRRGA